MNDFLTRQEAATFARVSVKTIDRWLRDPNVPINRHGGGRRVLISRVELVAYLGGLLLAA
jgi:excisionase family DNA binding protein